MGTPQLQKWLDAAAHAKANPSLIHNHRGTVDRALRQILVENTDYLADVDGWQGIDDVIESTKAENAAIKSALEVYA